jgi:hypothetical protein
MHLLPVSLGEAIDKLSILQIKCENISDTRKLDAEKEYSVLYEMLKEYIVRYSGLYDSMIHTNRIIWNQMDVLRDGIISGVEYTKLCRECIITNDMRFRIKNKINMISNSELREQKSYKITQFEIVIEVEGPDLLLFIDPIRQLSYMYDEILITSSKDLGSIRNVFHYDNTILWRTTSPRIQPTDEGGVRSVKQVETEPLVFYDTHDILARLGLSIT